MARRITATSPGSKGHRPSFRFCRANCHRCEPFYIFQQRSYEQGSKLKLLRLHTNILTAQYLVPSRPLFFPVLCHFSFLLSCPHKITEWQSHHTFLKPKMQGPVHGKDIKYLTKKWSSYLPRYWSLMWLTYKDLNHQFGFSSSTPVDQPSVLLEEGISEHDSWLYISTY